MRAALVAHKGHTFDIVDATLDEPRADEVLVRVVGVGICHSDVAAAEQHLPTPLPAVLGHEGAGVVVKVGAGVTGLASGDHVVMTFDSCGMCRNCSAGMPAYCAEFGPLNMAMRRGDGSSAIHVRGTPVGSFFFGQSSFAELAIAHTRNVVKIDHEVPLELMGPLGCGVQTGAGAIMRSLAAPAGSSLLVIGGGTVGLSAVMGGVIQGCATIIVSEPHAARRELALSLGATQVIDPLSEPLGEAVRRILPVGVDYAFDTSGRSDAISAALDSLATLGTLGLVAVPNDPSTLLQANLLGLVGRGVTIRGIVEGDSDPQRFIPELVALFKAGRFPLDRLCRTYPLAEINRAITDQLDGNCVKPVLLTEGAFQ